MKKPEIGELVLFEQEQFTIIEADHEDDIYGITNDNYEGYASLSELTSVNEDADTQRETAIGYSKRESSVGSDSEGAEPRQATAYIESPNGDSLLS